MEKLEFRPTKILLVFWIIGVVLACLPVGAIAAGACAESGIAWQKAFAAGCLIPMVVFTTYAFLFFHTIRYELNDRYVTAASGVLWKKRRSIPLAKITNIDVRQGPFERVFGYGKIWIFTPSTGAATPEEKLVGIPQPHEMKQTIIDRTEAEKQPQGSAKEAPIAPTEEVISILTDIRNSLKNIESTLSQRSKETQ